MSSNRRSFRMDPAKYPIVVPHVTWEDGALCFGRQPVRQMAPAEQELLSRCDGTRALRELAVTTNDARLLASVAPWLVWWDEPLMQPPTPRRSGGRLVLSPAPEDAWLAMGGRLVLEASEHPSTVVTCFGLTARTIEPLAFATPNEIAGIMRDELALAAQLAGVSHEFWELPASDLRHGSDDNKGAAASVDWLASMLREVLEETIARLRPAEVFVPFSSAPQSDAGLVLDVIIGMYVDGLLAGAELDVFESEPVSNGYRAIDEFLGRFEQSYIELSDYFTPIDAAIARKASMLEVFRSGLDGSRRHAWLETADWNGALRGARGVMPAAERFWTVSLAGAA